MRALLKRTRICKLLNIEYPLFQGGMLWLADAALASAVSNAKGLGVVSPFAGMDENGDPVSNFEKEIRKAKALTKNPFGVNVPLDLREAGLLLDVALREKVGIVITASGDPGLYTDWIHGEGGRVFQVVGSVAQAVKAEQCGVDGIIAEGCEAGGHVGVHEIPLFSLLPQVVDAVSLPVVAAGGIADGRGWVAAMALGAEGIQMGTRFVAVTENPAHPRYKEAILQAKDADTAITSRKVGPTRSLDGDFTRALKALEAAGASPETLRDFIGFRRARKAQLDGVMESGEAFAGSSAGLVHDMLPAAEVINRMVKEYDRVMRELLNESR